MRKILALAWNDIRLQFEEGSQIVFFLILPILFTVVLASTMRGGGDSRYRLLVVDEDQSELSARLVATLQASDVLRLTVASPSAAEKLFTTKDANIPVMLTVPSGFGQALMTGRHVNLEVRRASGDNRVLSVEQAVRAAADQVSSAVLAAQASVAEAERIRPFANEAARQAYFQQSLAAAQELLKSPPARVKATQAAAATRQTLDGVQLSSAGQLVTWTLITLIAAAEVLVYERLGGTFRRLVVTPTSKATILAGKVLGRLAAGLVQMAVLMGFGALVLGVQWGRSPAALALIVVTFGLAAVAMGILLGTFAKTRSQAGWLTIMFSMLTAALGGCWWPLEITPPTYQTMVKVLPTTWAMFGFNDVLVRGQGVAGVLPEAGILLLFALVFFGVGVKRLRFE